MPVITCQLFVEQVGGFGVTVGGEFGKGNRATYGSGRGLARLTRVGLGLSSSGLLGGASLLGRSSLGSGGRLGGGLLGSSSSLLSGGGLDGRLLWRW